MQAWAVLSPTSKRKTPRGYGLQTDGAETGTPNPEDTESLDAAVSPPDPAHSPLDFPVPLEPPPWLSWFEIGLTVCNRMGFRQQSLVLGDRVAKY